MDDAERLKLLEAFEAARVTAHAAAANYAASVASTHTTADAAARVKAFTNAVTAVNALEAHKAAPIGLLIVR